MRRFWGDRGGAALIYVSILLVAMVGIVGLAIDGGRMFTLREELQQAADAAALAGAYQLDGTLAGSQRATTAAQTAISNSQKFGQTPGDVSIASTAFWASIPADDDDALTDAPAPYDYIQVTTAATGFSPWFMQIVGATPTNLTATAVARKGQAICQVTPLFMCLPDAATFDPTVWVGHQVLMRAGQGNSWTNGNWGLLDTPGGSQSAGALASMIAGSNGLPQCINTSVDTKPGNVASISPAFNVRLDMYENLPGNINYRNTPGYAPAENVTKQKYNTDADCDRFNDVTPPTKMGRDTVIDPDTRLGNGEWDCITYWNTNHPTGPAAPAGCGAPAATTISRYETYLHEITNNLVPNTVPDYGASPAGEDGRPQCYAGGPIPPTPTAISERINDRRIFTVAGVDCASLSINGNTPNVPVTQYLSIFITEPAGTQGPTNGDVYMEIVGFDTNGGGGLAPVQTREWVELVR